MNTFLIVYVGAIAIAIGWWTGICTRPARAKRHATIPADAAKHQFCRDCRWAAPEPSGLLNSPDFASAKCMHPTAARNQGTVLVTGQYAPGNQHYCSTMRESTFSPTNCCGPDGAHWERR